MRYVLIDPPIISNREERISIAASHVMDKNGKFMFGNLIAYEEHDRYADGDGENKKDEKKITV